MASDWRGDAPELQEEIREARGHILELLGSVVLLSVLLGLAINLGSSLLAQHFNTRIQLVFIALGLAVPILFGLLLLPRFSTTTKEFHEEIEILLPLLIGPQDLEVVPITYYQDISETAHAALARCSTDERKQLADTFRGGTGQEITTAALEMTQFLLAVRVMQESRRLLGPEAVYHKFREIARAQSATVTGEWGVLAHQAPSNRYLGHKTPGVPERTLLPEGVRVTLPELAPQVYGKTRPRASTVHDVEYVTLLSADAGKDTALRISGLTTFSDHRLPALNAPHRGLTARCILRNARETTLHDLAREEEATAALLTEHGRPLHPPGAGVSDPTEQYARLFNRLYGGGRRVRLLRVFLRVEGAYRIRLLSSSVRQRGLYLWSIALSRALSRLDIEHFLATLKEEGQRTPKRTF
jgi:hypothetical protein